MRIREMREEDAAQAARLERLVFARPWSEQALRESLKHKGYIFAAAEEEGKICGYCGLQTVLEEGEITNVAVLPEYQGRQIGTELIRWILERAAEAGVTKIYLEVRESNERAIHLYQKFGFEKVGARKGFYEAPREDGLLFCRSAEK